MARPVTEDIVRLSPLRLDGKELWKSQKNDESSAKVDRGHSIYFENINGGRDFSRGALDSELFTIYLKIYLDRSEKTHVWTFWRSTQRTRVRGVPSSRPPRMVG